METFKSTSTAVRRRELLVGTAMLLFSATTVRAATIAGQLPWRPNAGNPPSKIKLGPWEFFTGEEGRTMEALADCIVQPDPEMPGGKDPQEFTQIERGRYLTITSDCVSCHTAPGGKPFAGERPIETPFGDIVAPNITPDLETGIGAWSDDAFDAAVRNGIRPNGAQDERTARWTS